VSFLLWTLGGLLALAVIVVLAGQLGAFTGRPAAELGWRDGRLAPPSKTPNSVSSQARLHAGHPQLDYADIDALPAGRDPDAALRRLGEVVQAMPGARIVEQRDDYLRAEFRTRWMGYVDDGEFALDRAAGVIQVRSASRLGRKDFGVNRMRIEAIRKRLSAGNG
jgi:uncharacterized protein (DUF1499 family)